MSLNTPPPSLATLPDPTWRPLYLDVSGLDAQTFDVIMTRVTAILWQEGYDVEPNSRLWHWIAPVPTELATWPIRADTVRRSLFLGTSWGGFLDLLGDLIGRKRLQPQKAAGAVTFTGTVGATVASGTVVSTPGVGAQVPILFQTTTSGVIPAGGTLSLPIVALATGTPSNVGAGSITQLVTTNAAITLVTNPNRTLGGIDLETDFAYRSALMALAYAIIGTGTADDYRRWLLQDFPVADTGHTPIGPVTFVALWAGETTCLITFLELDGSIPVPTRVTEVQTFINGKVPPFHVPTVQAPTAIPLSIQVPSLTLDPSVGITLPTLESSIQTALTATLVLMSQAGTVSLRGLEVAVKLVPGVLDFGDISLALYPSNVYVRDNITLESSQVATLHDVAFPSTPLPVLIL